MPGLIIFHLKVVMPQLNCGMNKGGMNDVAP